MYNYLYNIQFKIFFLRGRHGVVRRVLDKFTGSQYAAKFIHVCDEHQKRFFRTEVNMLRWLNQRGVPKVVDTFITERRIVIITEMYPQNFLLQRTSRLKDLSVNLLQQTSPLKDLHVILQQTSLLEDLHANLQQTSLLEDLRVNLIQQTSLLEDLV